MALAAALRDRELLLVLDNVEQVLDAAPLVHALLAAAAGLTVLVTSRVALRIGGKHTDRLPPLAELAAAPAVVLFLERARAVRGDFALCEATSLRKIRQRPTSQFQARSHQ